MIDYRLVKLSASEALRRLTSSDHGVLSTIHSDRGVSAVPAVFAVHAERYVGIPIDTVKPKTVGPLQRERNLAVEPRASLLTEQWNMHDWSQLWWSRADLRFVVTPPTEIADAATRLLTEKYAQYVNQPFARLLVFEIVGINGWAAQDG